MSDTRNPFEQAASIDSGGFDPFASGTADPFGSIPPPDLGRLENPIESPAAPPAGTPETMPSTLPIIDLGSQAVAAAPFTAVEQPSAPEPEGKQLRLIGDDEGTELSDAVNPIVAALAKQEQSEHQSVFAKAPIFEHGSVKEPIEDVNQTFEDLRVAKSDDFPELEDAVRVSWDVTYGKIRKTVPMPKKTKIGEFKKQIEASREFMDALKKEKNKSPDCIIKPRITAQSKGDRMPLPTYKGVFTNLEDSEVSGKVISIVPGRDGMVYEIRREETGMYITPSGECRELSEIRAGFTPALPLIPNHELRKVIGFFRWVMRDGRNFEAIANVYWDRERGEFRIVIPKQHVTAFSADSDLTDDYDPARFLHYMDIHSHNVMPARFSAQDDRDEKATRLYAVMGRLHEFIPELSVRLSNGGKYLLIDPATVLESFGDYYPKEWDEQVTLEKSSFNHETPDNEAKHRHFRAFGRGWEMRT